MATNTRPATSCSNGKKTTKMEFDGFPTDVTVCRVCLVQDRVMETMFDVPTSETESISDRILYCTGVKFSQQDGLSEKICKLCVKHLTIAHKFKITCLSADELCRKLLKEERLYEVPIGKNEISPPDAVVETKVKIEVLSDIDDGFKDDEKEQDSNSEAEVKPSIKKKCRKSGLPRKKKKFKFRRLFCEPCDIKFKSKEEVSSHNSKLHKDSTQRFICEICGKVFTNRSSHHTHVKSHTAPPLGCAHCDYTTTYKSDMVKHIRIHTGEKRFQCEYCSAAFFTSSNLLEHRRVNHSAAPTYRFACPRCGKQYYDRTKFQRHVDSHDSIKRHECDICHTRFSRRCYWKKHLLTRHGVDIPPMRRGRRKSNSLILPPVQKEGQTVK